MANASHLNASASRGLACFNVGAGSMIAVRVAGALQALRGRQISTDDASDESLVARVAHNDRRALQLLFGRHRQRVYRFALRLVGNAATADEIVNEVFLELWRRAASFERRAQLSTWLLAVTRNKALSVLRLRVDQPLEEAMAEAMPDPAINAEDSLQASERIACPPMPRTPLPGAPRDHRPRLLPREIGRRGRRHRRRACGDGEDPHVLRAQALGRAREASRHHGAAMLERRVIFSENRFPLFGITRYSNVTAP